ncbi:MULTISPECIES: MmgE/PrpD family protein [Bacillaceae]|uniref:MmgE/PrpD family protein n=1 Tax=Bacillaceae TaxID=186817 RepID=UPI00069CD775|nr:MULTISPECIES: MmgE/PrpD family protein [Bacillaceae]WHY33988.1 MmgE/PrpD family protein [Cytobacillus firmus]
MEVFSEKLEEYLRTESFNSVHANSKQALKEALADIIACTIAGTQTAAFEMVKKFADSQWGTGRSSVFSSAEKMSASGAALVNATAANALDMDDGHRLVKGHPGAIVFPAVLAAAEEYNVSGEEFMTSLLISYEIAIRAGIIAHQVRPEYHCTGSWGAIGAAAGSGKIMKLTGKELNHALGIAEYQSTYSPMMRCIKHPSMLKDGIGWGSMTGISAASLAKEGFTGIPSLFETVEAEPYLQELGKVYRVEELYYKPYACCRWAQPGIEALKELMPKHALRNPEINKVKIYTFTEAASLSRKYPNNTEEAQYNLTFPFAAYLVTGEVGPNQVLNELGNPEILNAMDKIEIYISDELDQQFPEKALSRIEIEDSRGHIFSSSVLQAKGDYDFPLSSFEKKNKFYNLVEPIAGHEICDEIYQCIQEIEKLSSIQKLTSLLNKKYGGIYHARTSN